MRSSFSSENLTPSTLSISDFSNLCSKVIQENPELIEKAGLKGTRIGGAVVSDRHANFIIAEPECTTEDVIRLIDLVRNQILERLGMELELELEVW